LSKRYEIIADGGANLLLNRYYLLRFKRIVSTVS